MLEITKYHDSIDQHILKTIYNNDDGTAKVDRRALISALAVLFSKAAILHGMDMDTTGELLKAIYPMTTETLLASILEKQEGVDADAL
jgi:hypothetical protein